MVKRRRQFTRRLRGGATTTGVASATTTKPATTTGAASATTTKSATTTGAATTGTAGTAFQTTVAGTNTKITWPVSVSPGRTVLSYSFMIGSPTVQPNVIVTSLTNRISIPTATLNSALQAAGANRVMYVITVYNDDSVTVKSQTQL